MAPARITRREVQTLYQIAAGLSSPEQIADVLGWKEERVEGILKDLDKKRLVQLKQKGGKVIKATMTTRGKAELEQHHKQLFR